MSRYSLRNLLSQEPSVVSGAVLAILNACVLFGAISASAEQLGAANVAMAAVLSLFVRQSVTPNAKL